MKLRKVLLASGLAIPSVVVPFTATSCSNTWGYLNPLSIGDVNASSANDPFALLRSTESYDGTLLDGIDFRTEMQSNYLFDTNKSTAYAYSLPQKWQENKDNPQASEFVDGSAGWYTSSDSAFVQSGTYEYTKDGKKVRVGVNSYLNNALSGNIDITSTIGQAISNLINAGLTYQGQQFTNDESLKTAWGSKCGITLDNFAKGSEGNWNFYQQIFAAGGNYGPGKANAVLRPTKVNFNYEQMFIPTYQTIGLYNPEDVKATVSDYTKTLLSKEATAPADAPKAYYTNKQEGKDGDDKFDVYTFTNVPIKVSVRNVERAFVNPQKNDSFVMSDYYTNLDTVTKQVGSTWSEIKDVKNYVGDHEVKPDATGFEYDTLTNSNIGIADDKIKDERITGVKGNEFIVLFNYTYQVWQDQTKKEGKDRVTLGAPTAIFPACFFDIFDDMFKENKYVADKSTWIVDEAAANKHCSDLLAIYNRTSLESMQHPFAKDLSEQSKKMLGFLGYMFADNSKAIDAANMIKIQAIN